MFVCTLLQQLLLYAVAVSSCFYVVEDLFVRKNEFRLFGESRKNYDISVVQKRVAVAR